MPKLSDSEIQTLLTRLGSIHMDQLLELCLDPETGVTIDLMREARYSKINQLEQLYQARAEDIIWSRSQGSTEALSQFIGQCQRGVFSQKHLAEAIEMRQKMAESKEKEEWEKAERSNDINLLNNFIKKCMDGVYSSNYQTKAIELAEEIDWRAAEASHDVGVMDGYIKKCQTGWYSHVSPERLKRATELLELWANGTILEDWNKLNLITDLDEKLNQLNIFIQTYATNPSKIAQEYMRKADDLMKQILDEKQARIDWIKAKEENTILSYVKFITLHPYSSYREEAEQKIDKMKGDLLSNMKRFPFRFRREDMYEYISTGALTQEDLVDKSEVLTDRGYNHIKRFPTLKLEQTELPISSLENPHSEPGSTDIFFFGVPGSGKTCVLSGLMSITGQLGFRFDPRGPSGGGDYALVLRNYARRSMLPPGTDKGYIQVIDAEINDEKELLHKISFIEMSGEKTARFAAMSNASQIDDLGPGAAGLLTNDNRKVLFFVIDPTNEKDIQLGDTKMLVMQSDVLNCITALLSRYPSLMEKVVAVHIILTKSDTLGDYVDQGTIMDLLIKQGYGPVLEDIKSLCQKYEINKQTGFQVGLYPFHVGDFMPGDVYTFDDTDSLKILKVIRKNTPSESLPGGFFDVLSKFFNS